MATGRRVLERLGLPVALAVAGCVVLVACGGSEYHYVTAKSPTLVYKVPVGKRFVRRSIEAADSYYKVPRAWAVFDEAQVLDATPGVDELTPTATLDLVEEQHVTGFDASAEPAAANLFAATTAPAGRQMVLVLDDDERDTVSLSQLRNYPFIVDKEEAAAAGAKADEPEVEVIDRDDEVVRPGGFHGTQVLFNLKGENGGAYTLNQTTLTDSASRVLYTFVIGCEANCYLQNVDTINKVVESWTIKEPK